MRFVHQQLPELITRLKAKDQSAFAVLYESHVNQVYAYVLSTLKSTPLTDDVVQEVFIKLWTAADLLDPAKPLKPYLFAIARNKSLNALRRVAKEQGLTEEITQSAIDLSQNTEALVAEKQTAAIIQLAVSQMPEKRRIIYDLCHQEGHSYQQTANKLGIKYSTVNTQMVRALKHIKAYLAKSGALLFSFFLFFS